MAQQGTIQFLIYVKCQGCGTEIFNRTANGEEDAQQEFAKAVTAAELHDCPPPPSPPAAAPKKAP